MKLKIDDHFTIEGNLNSFTLFYEEKYFDEDAKKERTSKDNWYYSNFRQCLEAYIEKSIVPCNSAQEILDKLEEVKNIINRK